MTYEQYKTILAPLETRMEAARRKLTRDGLNPKLIHQASETQAAINTLRRCFDQPVTVVMVRQ